MRKIFLIICFLSTACSFVSCDHVGTSNEANQEEFITATIALNTAEVKQENNKVFTDFIYDIGPRFAPIKKEVVKNATSIETFFDAYKLQEMEKLTALSIILMVNDQESDIREVGYTATFTKAQLALLKAASYDTNFMIKAEYLKKNIGAVGLEHHYASPYITIVPEKQAGYFLGMDVLKNYLKIESEEARLHVDPKKLKPAKLFFTVTKNGAVKNARLDRSSGYPSLDEKMIELITKLPGSWEPAENIDGEKVPQELVVSFGLMGC